MQSRPIHMPKWPVVKEKHIKTEPIIYVSFVFKLDDEYEIIKNKISAIKEIYS